MKKLFKYEVKEDLDLGKDPETRKPRVYKKGDVIEIEHIHLRTKSVRMAINAGTLVPSDADLVQSKSLAPEMMEEPVVDGMEKPEEAESEAPEEAAPEEAEVPEEAESEAPEEEPVPDLRNGIS